MENKEENFSFIRGSAVIVLILAVFFYFHYIFTGLTNIKALETVVLSNFAAEFLGEYKRKKYIKKNWIYLFVGIVLTFGATVNFILYFR